MNYNRYNEVINGKRTCNFIAENLKKDRTFGIGWIDEEHTHLDIIFSLGINKKCGTFQRGIKQDYLFVSIIDHTSYAFVPDTIKQGTYIHEKLGFNNSCGDKLKELINGIIVELNKDEENRRNKSY